MDDYKITGRLGMHRQSHRFCRLACDFLRKVLPSTPGRPLSYQALYGRLRAGLNPHHFFRKAYILPFFYLSRNCVKQLFKFCAFAQNRQSGAYLIDCLLSSVHCLISPIYHDSNSVRAQQFSTLLFRKVTFCCSRLEIIQTLTTYP